MTAPVKQHLIDPEICIRCHSCEAACPIGAIEHDDVNVVVKADACNFCMNCIPVCPTGSIDEWRWVERPYTLAEQYGWSELPAQAEVAASPPLEDAVSELLAQAQSGAGGRTRAPASASKPSVGVYTIARPAEAVVQGNYRLTHEGAEADVRHIILDFGAQPFPALEGQSLGILPPGEDRDGRAPLPRLYSISSPRDGERPNFNNLALTVKRTPGGFGSNYVCDLRRGDKVKVAGPYGSTFLMPNDPKAKLLMICTGTGAAPFRAFTMRRQRTGTPGPEGDMILFFGARTPDSLPYFGPLNKVPERVLKKRMAFSRVPGSPKQYVQDKLMVEAEDIAERLADPHTHVYICGLRGMEQGVEKAFVSIAESVGQPWTALRDAMREDGRYHVETY